MDLEMMVTILSVATGVLFLIGVGALYLGLKAKSRINKLLTGEGESIEEGILELKQKIKGLEASLKAQRSDIENIYGRLKNCVQKVGIIRYNAFSDTGSDMSFSIALLDEKDNGVVVSGIFGRAESTTYAKPIVKGNSSYPLTDEEKKAIEVSVKG